MIPDALETAGKLLPLFVEWVTAAQQRGKNPEAELRAMLDTVDVTVDQAEAEKFGGG